MQIFKKRSPTKHTKQIVQIFFPRYPNIQMTKRVKEISVGIKIIVCDYLPFIVFYVPAPPAILSRSLVC